MRILTIGDIVGENGLEKVKQILPNLKEEKGLDFIVANAENIAGGMGLTFKNWNELLKLPIHCFTMGNHTWAKKDIFTFIDHPQLIRPANYSKGVQGKGCRIYEVKDKKVAVINLIGRTDMNVLSENPFLVAENLVQKLQQQADIILIDFHAEATAEKIAMKHFLDGKVTVLVGTHTHVQTADEEITKKGMGYITDLGMTGPIHSVIGMEIEASVKRFVTSLPERYKLAEGECSFNSCIFEIDEATCQVKNVERIHLK